MPSSVPHTGPYDSDFDDHAFADPALALGQYEPDAEERSLALMAHLSGYAGLIVPFGNLLGPALIYTLKREESAFVEDQAREALNFQISIVAAAVVSAVLMVVLIGFPLMLVVVIWWFVGTAIGATKANDGEWYRHSKIWRPIKG